MLNSEDQIENKKENKIRCEPVFCGGLVCRYWPVWGFQSKHALCCLHGLPIILCQHRDLEKRGDVPVILQGCQTSFLPDQIVQYQTWQWEKSQWWMNICQTGQLHKISLQRHYFIQNKCNQKLQEKTVIHWSFCILSNTCMWINLKVIFSI